MLEESNLTEPYDIRLGVNLKLKVLFDDEYLNFFVMFHELAIVIYTFFSLSFPLLVVNVHFYKF